MHCNLRPFIVFAPPAVAASLRSVRLAVAFAAYLLLTFVSQPCQAAFHLWYIKEAYTNSTGSVQFIELFTSSSGQESLSGQTLKSNANTFTFPSTTLSPLPTTNHHLLLATSGFGAVTGGATPDFTLPVTSFFNPAGDTLTFAPTFNPPNGADKKSFASAPTDGINSLNYTGSFSASTIANNSPRNYAGAGLSVGTGDYNNNHAVDSADYVLWRKTLNQSAATSGAGADGNFSGTIDSGDYTYWRAHFGNAVSGAGSSLAPGDVPEPANTALFFVALLCVTLVWPPASILHSRLLRGR